MNGIDGLLYMPQMSVGWLLPFSKNQRIRFCKFLKFQYLAVIDISTLLKWRSVMYPDI